MYLSCDGREVCNAKNEFIKLGCDALLAVYPEDNLPHFTYCWYWKKQPPSVRHECMHVNMRTTSRSGADAGALYVPAML
jgi:hypothetical protein